MWPLGMPFKAFRTVARECVEEHKEAEEIGGEYEKAKEKRDKAKEAWLKAEEEKNKCIHEQTRQR
jgi:hypothetical protein